MTRAPSTSMPASISPCALWPIPIDEQTSQWGRAVRLCGIDEMLNAEVQRLAADARIGPFDALKRILGGAAAPGVLGTESPTIPA